MDQKEKSAVAIIMSVMGQTRIFPLRIKLSDSAQAAPTRADLGTTVDLAIAA